MTFTYSLGRAKAGTKLHIRATASNCTKILKPVSLMADVFLSLLAFAKVKSEVWSRRELLGFYMCLPFFYAMSCHFSN